MVHAAYKHQVSDIQKSLRQTKYPNIPLPSENIFHELDHLRLYT